MKERYEITASSALVGGVALWSVTDWVWWVLIGIVIAGIVGGIGVATQFDDTAAEAALRRAVEERTAQWEADKRET